MLDDVPFSMKAAQPREPQLLSSRFKWWPQLLEAGQSNCLGRYFMFVYDSFWQLRSSVQSVESPRGLELRLCQPSSRCPGSGGGQVAAHMFQRKNPRTRALSHKQIHTYMHSCVALACAHTGSRKGKKGERTNQNVFKDQFWCPDWTVWWPFDNQGKVAQGWKSAWLSGGIQETQVKFFLDVVFLSPWHWLLFLSLAEQRRSPPRPPTLLIQ